MFGFFNMCVYVGLYFMGVCMCNFVLSGCVYV